MELNLGPGASNVKCETSQSGAGNRGSGAKATSWSFDSQKQVCTCAILLYGVLNIFTYKGHQNYNSYPSAIKFFALQGDIFDVSATQNCVT